MAHGRCLGSASISSAASSDHGNQTVSEFLTTNLDEAIAKVEAHGKKTIAKFRKEAKKARENLEAAVDLTVPDDDAVVDDEAKKAPPRRYNVTVQCTDGFYKNQQFKLLLALDTNPVIHIGRSSGKKYKLPHGLSLPKDPEVSTTHAELRLGDDGKVYITDVNSTNGTSVNDNPIKPHKPMSLLLTAPTHLSIGSSELTLHFEQP
ncbi:hypothetical protein SPRG_19103 [Saprolegnia parasitica CBS 223.65]|uniref:FHA domain-containing protein n=1 Tax=Saprolegnia parasitica (strain CBS 223.65) TaxID=695850 RepID=A0A067D6I8_SAPPC|nr:hypothetical protein SPRG_19103 [Saprolegnia parasitica CBS 223.65]KDO34286.1 hypothetical protein SPRG_19103 [Saprolegnia parasitica CBS 223.65]|eukprot:XP_012195298.1 hypothetical protein SPRG_19103 [Saprolegnia parasitica CBS 223.65]